MEFHMGENGFKTQFSFGELHVSADDEYGFRPYQLLVSSVAVCSAGVLRKILDKKRIVYDDIKVTADVQRNDKGAQEIQRIHLHFIITGQGLEQDKIEKVLLLTRKNCSMVQSVKDNIDVLESFELIQS